MLGSIVVDLVRSNGDGALIVNMDGYWELGGDEMLHYLDGSE